MEVSNTQLTRSIAQAVAATHQVSDMRSAISTEANTRRDRSVVAADQGVGEKVALTQHSLTAETGRVNFTV
jgi:hypothetical protein